MYIDYAGDKLEIVEEQTGEVRKVEVFVATLPCSHYTYCEAVVVRKKEDLIVACENALHFFGGVPKAVVPEPLSAVIVMSLLSMTTSLLWLNFMTWLFIQLGAPSQRTRHWLRML